MMEINSPPPLVVGRSPRIIIRRRGMEIRERRQNDRLLHGVRSCYNHTDPCSHSRWNAKESYEYMYNKNWQPIHDFYYNLVQGKLSVTQLFPIQKVDDDGGGARVNDDGIDEIGDLEDKKKGGRWDRQNFKIVLAYSGSSFDGWQRQPGLNTVQGVVEASLGGFVDEKKAALLKSKGLPIEGAAVVAGRTDKGVSALQQVCAFYTWATHFSTKDVADAVKATAAPGTLRVVSVDQVSRSFHPNFSAQWRRYLYLFPLYDQEVEDWPQKYDSESNSSHLNASNHENGFHFTGHSSSSTDEIYNEGQQLRIRPHTFSVSKVDSLLRQLEGKLLSYKMFARDTKASRSEGPPTECFMHHARATEAILPSLVDNDGNLGTRVMCVELVANRFLRRMVRVLVATSIREAAADAADDSLLKLMEATCRRATAPPAPPDGLCLVNVGYAKFDSRICLIT